MAGTPVTADPMAELPLPARSMRNDLMQQILIAKKGLLSLRSPKEDRVISGGIQINTFPSGVPTLSPLRFDLNSDGDCWTEICGYCRVVTVVATVPEHVNAHVGRAHILCYFYNSLPAFTGNRGQILVPQGCCHELT
jgi:hypothetical protein